MSKVGLFSVGLDTYWGQFGALLNNLTGYHNQIRNKLESFGAEVVDAGMVDNIDKAQVNARNKRIAELIAKKEDEALENKSIEELRAMIKN